MGTHLCFELLLLLLVVQAWSSYISEADYLPTLDAKGRKAEIGLFVNLMRYAGVSVG
jgi:hypothetical protein